MKKHRKLNLKKLSIAVLVNPYNINGGELNNADLVSVERCNPTVKTRTKIITECGVESIDGMVC
ncbi:hypothetical protein [Kordia jejudonensis]|uniref:hypothetical protein n=1 Tax=Kordia jejudonensis TaxID=1348245 RepID=UPI00062901EB|nr:hypothetical protein [Kordia jejudonensis]